MGIMILLTSCGIEVVPDHHSDDQHHDYLTLNLAYIDENGGFHELKNECIDLDGPSDSASITVHNEVALHELNIEWTKRVGQFKLRFYEGFSLFHNTFYRTDFFRTGQSSEISLELDGVDYLVNLSGPHCRGDY